MRLRPRRILLHLIILVVTLALPFLLPSSCGPLVHSEAALTAASSNSPTTDTAVHVSDAAGGRSAGIPVQRDGAVRPHFFAPASFSLNRAPRRTPSMP
jgi:hypothetical protein